VTIGLLYLAPAIVLLALLVVGLYPGEGALQRVRERWAPRRGRASAARPVAPRRPECLLARGGRLLSTPFAGRPPPLTAV
jgi:hypothetical protein